MIHTIDTDETRDLISPDDPAVDIGASDLDAYERTLDTTHLALREGETPTVFVVRAIDSQVQRRCVQRAARGVSDTDIGGRLFGQRMEFFNAGCIEIRNLTPQHRRVKGGKRGLPEDVLKIVPPGVQFYLGKKIEELSDGIDNGAPTEEEDGEDIQETDEKK